MCGAFLGIYDNDRRLADHFGGKLHVGFIVLRKKCEELKVSGLVSGCLNGIFFSHGRSLV